MSEAGRGPEVYQLAQAYPLTAAAAQVEQALGRPVARIERDRVAGSHAVFFDALAGGQEVVLRVATHPEHDLASELWAAEQARAAGLPVPAVLAAETERCGGTPPWVILWRAPGVPAHAAVLTEAERAAVFEELGRYAARLHALPLPGLGPLAPATGGWAGRFSSWAAALLADLDQSLAALPNAALSRGDARSIRERFRSEPLLALPAARLVHGDFLFKNLLLGDGRVSAILDFELAMAGDPLLDLAWLLYSDGRDARDRDALLRGDGAASEPPEPFRRCLLLYQLRYTVGHLDWAAGFGDAIALREVRERIHAIEQVLDSG